MSGFEVVTCTGCDYQRHLTEAESNISHALVFSCLRCGSRMQSSFRTNLRLQPEPDLESATSA